MPHYPEWRRAVANVFAQIDPCWTREVAREGPCAAGGGDSPAELPADPGRMWLRIQSRGKRIALRAPENADDYLPLLLTGEKQGRAPTIAERFASGKKGGAYSSWIVEANAKLSRFGGGTNTVVKCSYTALDTYRKRLMSEVQNVVTSQDVPGPRQLSAKLKTLKILASEGDLARDPILGEFARAIFLSGNGTLLINNTFVEWATVQAIRRARPSVAVIGFGIRNKVKPFSSLLIYADQDATNPIPSQMDTLGSYVDLEVFDQYIWQEFDKYAEYRNNTAYLFIGEGLEEALAIAPPDFPLLMKAGPFTLPDVFGHLTDWLGV